MFLRRRVRVLPFLVFCLLVRAATAHAECSWVLWVRSKTQPWKSAEASSMESGYRRRTARLCPPPAATLNATSHPFLVLVVGDDHQATIQAFQVPRSTAALQMS
jgi:hypothetical protein